MTHLYSSILYIYIKCRPCSNISYFHPSSRDLKHTSPLLIPSSSSSSCPVDSEDTVIWNLWWGSFDSTANKKKKHISQDYILRPSPVHLVETIENYGLWKRWCLTCISYTNMALHSCYDYTWFVMMLSRQHQVFYMLNCKLPSLLLSWISWKSIITVHHLFWGHWVKSEVIVLDQGIFLREHSSQRK